MVSNWSVSGESVVSEWSVFGWQVVIGVSIESAVSGQLVVGEWVYSHGCKSALTPMYKCFFGCLTLTPILRLLGFSMCRERLFEIRIRPITNVSKVLLCTTQDKG